MALIKRHVPFATGLPRTRILKRIPHTSFETVNLLNKKKMVRSKTRADEISSLSNRISRPFGRAHLIRANVSCKLRVELCHPDVTLRFNQDGKAIIYKNKVRIRNHCTGTYHHPTKQPRKIQPFKMANLYYFNTKATPCPQQFYLSPS